MLIELTQPTEEGTQSITALSEHISFAGKQPLQPIFQVGIGGVLLPCIGVYDTLVEKLEKAGLVVFDTPDGGRVAVNPKHIAFFVTPKLGIYSFIFGGKASVTVKATFNEITQLFEGKSSIIT